MSTLPAPTQPEISALIARRWRHAAIAKCFAGASAASSSSARLLLHPPFGSEGILETLFLKHTRYLGFPIETANMRRQGQYSDAGINPALAAQMQRMSAYRAQHSPGVSHFAGRLDPASGEDEHQYLTSKEGHWQWDRDGQRGASSLPSSHGFGEGQRLDSKASSEKDVHADTRSQAQEQDADTGYHDNSLPRTFDSLERKFHDDIMKLTKEHQDAEDAENARHRERLIEINAQYQEKLSALRSGQAARRENFLREESQARYQQYQQARLNSYPGSGTVDPYAFGLAGTAVDTVGDGNRPYGGSQLNSYRERSQFGGGGGGGRGLDSRGPYPGGRAYGANIRHY